MQELSTVGKQLIGQLICFKDLLDKAFERADNVWLLELAGDYGVQEDPTVLDEFAGPRYLAELYTRVASILSIASTRRRVFPPPREEHE